MIYQLLQTYGPILLFTGYGGLFNGAVSNVERAPYWGAIRARLFIVWMSLSLYIYWDTSDVWFLLVLLPLAMFLGTWAGVGLYWCGIGIRLAWRMFVTYTGLAWTFRQIGKGLVWLVMRLRRKARTNGA